MLGKAVQMGKIYIKEYFEMDKEECIRSGYMILKKGSKYFVRLAGFPLMVLLEFNEIKEVHTWIDAQGEKHLLEKTREIRNIRKFQNRFGSC